MSCALFFARDGLALAFPKSDTQTRHSTPGRTGRTHLLAQRVALLSASSMTPVQQASPCFAIVGLS